MRSTTKVLMVIATAAIIASAMVATAFAAPIMDQSFESGPLDTSVWSPLLWGIHTNPPELQYYDSSALSFANGGLRITSSRTPLGGKSYTSGIITGADRVGRSYGYYEMRAKLPKGKGIWPAFWLMNDPSSHEIDCFELLGNDPTTIYMTYHYNHSEVYQAKFTGPDFSAGYHTFAVDWQPTYIRWYVDGVKRGEYTGTISGDPLYIVANTAVGGDWPGNPDATTVFPQYYDIDYIRTYTTLADATAVTTPPATDPTTTVTPTKRVKRVSGRDRYATAVQISASTFQKADYVVLATGLDYADALAASPLAGALEAPVLLVPGTSLPADVSDEIARLGATRAVIAGGKASVSSGVAATLAGMGVEVERIAGPDRYATAAALARRTIEITGQAAGTVFMTRGDNFADALSVSSVAYAQRIPVLLVKPAAVPAASAQALAELAPAKTILVGGTAAISGGVENAVRAECDSVERLAGSDRYGTSAKVAAFALEQGWVEPQFIGVAAGNRFPDALGGGAACGDENGILLLTSPTTLSAATRAFLADNEADVAGVSIFGGTATVNTAVENDLASVLP